MSAKKEVFDEIVLQPDYAAQIVEIIQGELPPEQIGERIADFHENDIAQALELLEPAQRATLVALLDDRQLADVLAYSECRNDYIRELENDRKVGVLSMLEPAMAAEFLQELVRQERKALLDRMEIEIRQEIMLLSSFQEDEIGSKMTTNYISIPAGISIKQAMRELVKQSADNDNISTIYVVDENEALVGAIDLKDLIIARESTALEDITLTSYPYVYAGEQIAECLEWLKEYSEDSIPVLDEHGRLTGVLIAQEITRLVDETMGDDYAKLGGLIAEEDMREPLKQSVRKRLPWLVILLGLGLLVSGVVGLFEQVVASLTVVVCFQSLILGMAGNVGTQSLAVTVRVLMDSHLQGRQKFSLVVKEAKVGLCNGLLLGALSFALIGLYLMAKGEAAQMAFSVSACTGIALVVAMSLSSIFGTTVPLLFKQLNIDPAVASGPLITTVNDLVAVVAYYGLAWLLLVQKI